MFRTFKMMAAGLATAVMMAGSANALTSVSAGGGPLPGGGYDITSDTLFSGTVSTMGGPGVYMINFQSPIDPLFGVANASITINLLSTFTGLTVSWVDALNPANVLASTSVLGGVQTTLSTLFSSVSPNTLSQNLVFSWANSQGATDANGNPVPVTFDFDVAPVPLPAGGLLLLTALGGLALTRRRKAA